ncbi:MAG: flagellar hook-length control protein FliK, partial [Phycisphaerae bacterium]
VKKLSEAEQAARAEVTAEADGKTAGTGATNTDPWAGYRPGRQFGVNPAETARTDVAQAAAESATTAANNTAPGQTATATAGTAAPAGTPQAATTAAAGSEAAQTNQAGSQNVAAETADAAATEQASTQKAVQAAATEPAAPETQNPQAVAAAPETATEAGSEQTRQPARPADATQPATENPAAQRARSEYANNSGPAAKVNPADDPAASDAVSRETNSATTAPARPAAQNRNTNDRPGTSSQQIRSVAQAVGNAGPTAETSPTQAPTAPVDRLADAQPGRQIMEALQARTFQNNDQITIRLDPPEMGSVRIRIQTDESGGLRARLEVENNRTMTELQRETPSLMQRLSENGIEMRRLEFSFTGQDSSDGQAGFSMFQNASDGQGQSAGRGPAGTGEEPEQAVIEEDTPVPAVREQADGSVNVVM